MINHALRLIHPQNRRTISVFLLMSGFALAVLMFYEGEYALSSACKTYIMMFCLAGILICLSAFYVVQEKVMYIRNGKSGHSPKKFKEFQCSDVEIRTADNIKLQGWYIQRPSPDKLFVCFHGNKGIIGSSSHFLKMLSQQANSNIVMFAYRGFSKSEGYPTQKGLENDAQAIMKFALEKSQAENLPLYVFGRSLGGAVAIYASGLQGFKHEIKGLVLENTFTSTTDAVARIIPGLFLLKYFLKLINKNPWESVRRINLVECPILFIRGMKDLVVHPENTWFLLKEAEKHGKRTFLYEVQQGQHNNTWTLNESQYYARIKDFLANNESNTKITDKSQKVQ